MRALLAMVACNTAGLRMVGTVPGHGSRLQIVGLDPATDENRRAKAEEACGIVSRDVAMQNNNLAM